ncbi:hypothetical protein HLRTI_000571 [Halorhabdus tiamatea SARL4B]|uniref:DUF309 domain-containing protein n=1 Tax=Halorhabdus tiamatea SARL4B TaxID=1033806 RepID=F7PQ34_9EURY|nr:DUF309 domain-containing protein [Halorhabdus tiamatea]ERJ07213.1 hypothetical protein HLRTI_000571 [Halorhabdus tiamatea SARL4B]CCQ34126.1 conserved hypothetical protein (DUF309) [Halorhabdus tiamatea SARL4B]
MDAALRAGIALYNAGYYRITHDAWEAPWIGMGSRQEPKDFLQGLIQFTVAIHHATVGNESGARKLAGRAQTYLEGYPEQYQGVDLAPVREYLAALEADPDHVEDTDPPTVTHHGDVIELADLDFAETTLAAEAIAEVEGDEDILDDAIEYAEDDLEAGDEGSQFITFVFDYVRSPDDRPIIRQRLDEHVDRRQGREADVEGLFE